MQLREVQREEHRGDQLQHAASSHTYVAEATAAIGLFLVDGELVEIVAVGQDWRALAPRAVAPSRRHRVCPESHTARVVRLLRTPSLHCLRDRRALRDGGSDSARTDSIAPVPWYSWAQPAAGAPSRVHPPSLCVQQGIPLVASPSPEELVHVRGHGCAPIHSTARAPAESTHARHLAQVSGVSSRRRWTLSLTLRHDEAYALSASRTRATTRLRLQRVDGSHHERHGHRQSFRRKRAATGLSATQARAVQASTSQWDL